MPLKKNLGQRHTQHNFSPRVLLVLPLLSLLASCATTFVPGLDRILFQNSSAKVGPLVTVDEQSSLNDDQTSVNLGDETVAKPVNIPPVESGKTESDQTPKTATESKPVPQTTVSIETSSPKPIVDQPPTIEAKPANTTKLESPDGGSPEVTTEKKPTQVAIEYGAVAGKVILSGDKEKALPATGTMITLTPQVAVKKVQNSLPQVHVIDMEDKTYQPRFSTINAGDQVVFVNKDNIRHNVFSSSGNNAFDLGTYGAGLKRAVTLTEPGIVKIYCNIHAEMATFVAVGNQGLSVKTDDQGRYQIGEVLPGTYEVAIWNIRGEKKQIVEVKANETVKLLDRIDTTAFKIESHKNKLGGKYSKNSTLFEDEFY